MTERDRPEQKRLAPSFRSDAGDEDSAISLRNQIDERIAVFSARYLGFDPKIDERAPKAALDEMFYQMGQNQKRRDRFGIAVWTFFTAAIIGIVGSVIWPFLLAHIK